MVKTTNLAKKRIKEKEIEHDQSMRLPSRLIIMVGLSQVWKVTKCSEMFSVK